MVIFKSGFFKVRDPSGKIIGNRLLIKTKKARDNMRKEGFSFEEVD